MKIKVVGIATGSKDLEVWHFDRHDDFCKSFCEHLVQSTYKAVWVIEGEVLGKYVVRDTPIDFVPFSERFKEMAKTAKLPSTYSGDFINQPDSKIKGEEGI